MLKLSARAAHLTQTETAVIAVIAYCSVEQLCARPPQPLAPHLAWLYNNVRHAARARERDLFTGKTLSLSLCVLAARPAS